jgi:hypothetical protein
MRTERSLRNDDRYCKLTPSQRRFFHAWNRAHARQLQAAAVTTTRVVPISDARSLRIRGAA